MSTQSIRIGCLMPMAFAVVLLVSASPFTRPARAAWNPGLLDSAEEAVQAFRDKAPDLEVFFDQAYGYAVFPRVKKGGLGVGGARGKGVVFEQGEPIGSATLTQATVGFQAGGQVYSEVIFFENEEALDRFTEGGFKLAAQAAAVAADKGVSTDAAYSDGVAIFTMTKGGLMYEASVGGQRFKFKERDLD
jgi:lipid-binding SYLF domain-containing protein